MEGCIGPALYAGLYRRCTILRAVQALHYSQGCTDPTLCARVYRSCTICGVVQALH